MWRGIWTGFTWACNCQAMAALRYGHLDHHFTKPGGFANISVSKVLQSLQSLMMLNTSAKGCTKDRKVSRSKGECGACPNVLYSTLFYSTLFYSILFNPILFYSTLLYSILLYSIISYSILFYSIQSYSTLFYSILLYYILFYSIISYSILFYSILLA